MDQEPPQLLSLMLLPAKQSASQKPSAGRNVGNKLWQNVDNSLPAATGFFNQAGSDWTSQGDAPQMHPGFSQRTAIDPTQASQTLNAASSDSAAAAVQPGTHGMIVACNMGLGHSTIFAFEVRSSDAVFAAVDRHAAGKGNVQGAHGRISGGFITNSNLGMPATHCTTAIIRYVLSHIDATGCQHGTGTDRVHSSSKREVSAGCHCCAVREKHWTACHIPHVPPAGLMQAACAVCRLDAVCVQGKVSPQPSGGRHVLVCKQALQSCHAGCAGPWGTPESWLQLQD